MSNAKGVIIAAPASGSGKTVITLGLLRCLRRRGLAVASAKVGPDYIDPAFHTAASGRACFNLDGWAMRRETLDGLVAELGHAADLVICEGVMGLFDGIDAAAKGSTAELAERLGWPIVLVMDVRGQAASAAAVLAGCVRHRQGTRVAGVVFNRVGGASHRSVLAEACRRAMPAVAQLGFLGRDHRLELPERHLGLVQAAERANLEGFIDGAADAIGAALDTDAMIALAEPLRAGGAGMPTPIAPIGQRIAIADDIGFAFSYKAILDGWRNAGAEILPFSPLADEPPSSAADAVYLPGGYPELYAARLAGNAGFLQGLRRAAARGAAVYGECGGYMVLGEGLVDGAGERHGMAGLLPLEASFAERRLHLGYRQVLLLADSALGPAGSCFRSHEFHYATVLKEGAAERLFEVEDARGNALGPAGTRIGRVAGSFIHLIDRAR